MTTVEDVARYLCEKVKSLHFEGISRDHLVQRVHSSLASNLRYFGYSHLEACGIHVENFAETADKICQDNGINIWQAAEEAVNVILESEG